MVVLLAALVLGANWGPQQAPSPAPPPLPPASALVASQITVEVRHDLTQSRFRATVTRRDGDVLTVVTAAHCLSAADRGHPARITVGGIPLRGEVVAVVWNPAYRPKVVRDLHGPDSAVAWFRVRHDAPGVDQALASIRPATGPIEHAFPDPGGRTVVVRMVDAQGQEHVIRAGNHMNPRWLEWGPAYFPQPGDSGGGVFWVRTGSDGKPAPVLVGTIVGHDARGGGAALVSLDQGWLAQALARPVEPLPAIPVPAGSD